MAHPKHPTCSKCGKALFKSALSAKVKPTDPYAFCRNKSCEDYCLKGAAEPDGKVTKAKRGETRAAVPEKPVDQAVPVEGASEPAKSRKKAPPPAIVPADIPKADIPAKPTAVSKRGLARKAVPADALPKLKREAEPIAKARQRIREIVTKISDGRPREAIGLVLALVSQETGNQSAADALIKEFKLDEKFGLQAQ